MFRLLGVLLVVGSFFVGAGGSKAGNMGTADATVGCMLGPSKSIYLFQEEKTVLLSSEGRDAYPLKMERFEVYRCPGCFGFVGTGDDGHRYEGQTEGVYNDETGRWEVFLDLRIDGGEAQRSACFWRH